MGCAGSSPPALAPDEPGEALSHRVIELQRRRRRALRLLRQQGQHHVVELLHPSAPVDGVARFGGTRELYHLRAPSRGENRCGIGRQSPARLQPLLHEARDRHLGRGVIANIEILPLEVLPGALVAKADQHLVLIAEQRRGGEVRRPGQHAPPAPGAVGQQEDLCVRDVTLDHPDLESPFAHALEHRVAARFGQAPKRAVDLLQSRRLQRNDRRHIVHHARVPEHALHARLGEALEHGVQHLHARGVGEDADVAILREGIEVEIARLDRACVKHTRSGPSRIGRKQPKGARRLRASRASMVHRLRISFAQEHRRPEYRRPAGMQATTRPAPFRRSAHWHRPPEVGALARSPAPGSTIPP